MTKLPFFPAALAAASFMLLFIGSSNAQVRASGLNYDITAHYICDRCTDWQSATAFAQKYIAAKHCDLNDVDGEWVELREDGRGSMPGETKIGGEFVLSGTRDGSPAYCTGPDERANVLNPNSRTIYTFIVERRSQGRDGMPPLAYPWPSALSQEERLQHEKAMNVVRNYREAIKKAGDRINEWISAHYSGPAGSRQMADYENELLCPSYTVLGVLGDSERLAELRSELHASFQDSLAEYIDESSGSIRFSGGTFSVDLEIFEEQINYDVRRSQEGFDSRIRIFFPFMEGSDDQGNSQAVQLERADYLSFTFEVLTFHQAVSRVRGLALDLNNSRIHGKFGYLTRPELRQHVEGLDDCSRKHMISMGERGLLPGYVVGTGSGGGRPINGGYKYIRVTWDDRTRSQMSFICDSYMCCTSSGRCVPKGSVR
ncbi:hypothetical protein [Natronospira bacteriovora]|uniref:Uncharacterized protein n=1 Tax=Natronospira bacteriovora TaxID=3069753 RepID=A0ABU0W6H5_9GAMM|nr:hypothetical protein [Natronospira sp. AB-CW4]MDQ2069627.1 hypothetical protein [Natronospira sp. AB-CW4]